MHMHPPDASTFLAESQCDDPSDDPSTGNEHKHRYACTSACASDTATKLDLKARLGRADVAVTNQALVHGDLGTDNLAPSQWASRMT